MESSVKKKVRPTRETLQYWISAIQDEEDKLTEWETNFVQSIDFSFRLGCNLSERQEEILERIYAEKTP